MAINTPLKPEGLAQVAELAGGSDHTCARLSDATVHCWGTNQHGQLGDATFTPHTAPVPVAGLSAVAQIAAGHGYTCAVQSAGSVACWGGNELGQLGAGHTTDTNTPTAVVGVQGALQVAADDMHTCARLQDGTVACWGYNAKGQLGQTPSFQANSTAKIVPGLSNVAFITVGEAHSCALLADASVRCWGGNALGQLGNGGVGDVTITPQPVPGLSGVAQLAASGTHTCALLKTGELLCWGRNSHGQLGDGTQADRAKPTPVVW
jgi:alpha-tubulin suppressor-like RCC1 family protein